MDRSRSGDGRVRLDVSRMEDRLAPAALAGSAAGEAGWYAVGSQPDEVATATVYDADGAVAFTVTPYGEGFTGGVRVTLADVTGDGTADLVTAPGQGTDATVKVFDGATRQEVASFAAYEAGFTGGANVAAADLNGDGKAEIVTGADEGGAPRVKVFDGATATGTATPNVLTDFPAIDDSNFRGGVRLALGDIGGDGVADLLVAAGVGGGPRAAAYDGAALADGQQVKLVPDFFAFEPELRNGVYPSVGDLNSDGHGDLLFGAGPGGAPRVVGMDGLAAQQGDRSVLTDFFAGDATGRAGAQVGTVGTAGGGTELMGVDRATGAVGFFGPDGGQRPGRGTQHGGSVAGMPFGAVSSAGNQTNFGGMPGGSSFGGMSGTGNTGGPVSFGPSGGGTATGPNSGTTSPGQTGGMSAFGQQGGMPTFGQQGGMPAFDQQGDIPTFDPTSGAPSFGQAGGMVDSGHPSGMPMFGRLGGMPSFGPPSGMPSFGPTRGPTDSGPASGTDDGQFAQIGDFNELADSVLGTYTGDGSGTLTPLTGTGN